MTDIEDRFRREALATFQRSVAHIQNLFEGHKVELPEGMDVELIADLAIMATLGPPLDPDETTFLDYDDPEEIEAAPADEVPAMLRRHSTMMTAHEIIQVAGSTADVAGFSADPEIRACETAMHVTYQQEKSKGLLHGVQSDWTVVSHYLSNHNDGYWMLTEPGIDDDDDDEEGVE